MSNSLELKTLWARAAKDAGFRARFLRDPLAAAACLGIALNATQVSAAKDLHEEISSTVLSEPAACKLPLIISLPGQLPTLVIRP